MKIYIFTILLAIMLTGCNIDVDHMMYDDGYKITAKLADRSDDYKYWYRLINQERGRTLGWYSDKNYDVGDIIWMGAMWGRKYNKDVDLDSN